MEPLEGRLLLSAAIIGSPDIAATYNNPAGNTSYIPLLIELEPV